MNGFELLGYRKRHNSACIVHCAFVHSLREHDVRSRGFNVFSE